MAVLVDLKLFNIINYITFIFNPTSIPILKVKYNYKGKTKSILIPIKIAAKKAARIIKKVIIYKYNIA